MRLGRFIVKKSHLYLSRIIHAEIFELYIILVICGEMPLIIEVADPLVIVSDDMERVGFTR